MFVVRVRSEGRSLFSRGSRCPTSVANAHPHRHHVAGHKRTPTGLPDIYGIGPVITATILGQVGDIARFRDRHQFASYNGTADDKGSAGRLVHCVNFKGNRRQLPLPDPGRRQAPSGDTPPGQGRHRRTRPQRPARHLLLGRPGRRRLACVALP